MNHSTFDAAAGVAPVIVVFGLAHELRLALLLARLVGAHLLELAPTRSRALLAHLIDRPFEYIEHMFVSYSIPEPRCVPKLCRYAVTFTPTPSRQRGSTANANPTTLQPSTKREASATATRSPLTPPTQPNLSRDSRTPTRAPDETDPYRAIP